MLMLLATGATLNLQSYMGIIMSTGVSVANAILIVTNAESLRLGISRIHSKQHYQRQHPVRPILMTSLAMIAGMIPMASGLGEAGDQSAPLGRAVIGGLAASTFAALFIVPLVYGWIQQKTSFKTCFHYSQKMKINKYFHEVFIISRNVLFSIVVSCCQSAKPETARGK